MGPAAVRECMSSPKIKNTEGFDKISQRVLLDGVDILVQPFGVFFNKIYHEKNTLE
jgi:hypothetical protein